MARSASYSAPKLFSLIQLNIPRQQLLYILIKIHRRCRLQNVEQILIWIKLILLRGFNHAKNDRAALCTTRRVGKQEVFSINDKRLYASLRTVVDDFQSAVFKIRSQIRPLLLQQIVDHFVERRLRGSIPALCSSQKGVQNRFFLLLSLIISFGRTALFQLVFNGKQLITVRPSLVNLRGFLCAAGNTLSASSKYRLACAQQPTPRMFSGRVW